MAVDKVRNKYFFGLVMLALAVCVCISGCTESADAATADKAVVPETNPVSGTKIEVFHFHGNRQCPSCKTVGAYAEETVKTYFSDELESGKIVFGHINAELPENRETALKYGATGSSLWIGVYEENGNFSKEENVNVWYKINDKQDYMDYLKQVLEQKLIGN